MTYSFDIFDTCLVRKCGKPEHLFEVLAWSVFVEPADECTRKEFVAARMLADTTGETLDAIYANLPMKHSALKSTDKLVELEKECERKMLVPVVSMREKINKLRSEGHHIIYISDMYLPDCLIREIMIEAGFLTDEDTLYVSCEVGCRKSDGKLYEYVRERECLNYRYWHHEGDHPVSDCIIPKHLGIDVKQIGHAYTRYQSSWMTNECNNIRHTGSLVAGLSRAIRYQLEDNGQREFTTDIVAPFCANFVARVLNDAKQKGIKRLYFCARDAYSIYLVAKELVKDFDNISVHYLYISQTALYEGDKEAKRLYFEQCGLASKTDKVAIVDLRTSGHTLNFMNDYLIGEGFLPVRGYFFEMFCTGKMQYLNEDYQCEINQLYVIRDMKMKQMIGQGLLFEMFFSIHSFQRTIGYKVVDGIAEPIFDERSDSDEENGLRIENKDYWSRWQDNALELYTRWYRDLGLVHYADEIMETNVIPTMLDFFSNPKSEYVRALEKVEGYHWGKKCFVPYVKQMSWWHVLKTRGKDTCWKQGTLCLSLPEWLINWWRKC